MATAAWLARRARSSTSTEERAVRRPRGRRSTPEHLVHVQERDRGGAGDPLDAKVHSPGSSAGSPCTVTGARSGRPAPPCPRRCAAPRRRGTGRLPRRSGCAALPVLGASGGRVGGELLAGDAHHLLGHRVQVDGAHKGAAQVKEGDQGVQPRVLFQALAGQGALDVEVSSSGGTASGRTRTPLTDPSITVSGCRTRSSPPRRDRGGQVDLLVGLEAFDVGNLMSVTRTSNRSRCADRLRGHRRRRPPHSPPSARASTCGAGRARPRLPGFFRSACTPQRR